MCKIRFILLIYLLTGLTGQIFSKVNLEWFSTYSGGFTPNLLNDFTIDSAGNSYLVGEETRNSNESEVSFASV